jgi:SNF2 family DNA or RNA helicase
MRWTTRPRCAATAVTRCLRRRGTTSARSVGLKGGTNFVSKGRTSGLRGFLERPNPDPWTPAMFSRPYEPKEYMKAAIRFMIQQGAAGLFLDPGLGKTAITLSAFKILKARGIVKRALVIAPLRVANSTWPREVRKWENFSDLKMAVLHGNNKNRLSDPSIDIDVINPEGLEWLLHDKGEGRRPAISKQPWFWDMLVVDESTQFKHTNTQRFRLLRPYLRRFARRYILTGSPAPNGLLDLYGQIYLLDGGAAFGRGIQAYRINYFNPGGFNGYQWTIKPGAEEQIYKKVKPLVMRLEAKDYLDLPPLVENTIEVELPAAAMRQYKEMEATLVSQFVRGEVVAQNAAAATIKCRQIANGGIYHDQEEGGKRVYSNIHSTKIDCVKELVEELQGQPALIAYEFQHDLDRLKAAFPFAPHLGAGVTAAQQERIEDDWNAGRLPVLLAQPQSVAHGLNLQGTGAAIIKHSLTWDLERDEQFTRRVWRQGQEKRVVVHYIVAKGTVDEVIRDALIRKEKTQRGLLDALKSYIRRA